MASLYEIESGILEFLENEFTEECVTEDGEIDQALVNEYFDQLLFDRNEKIESISLYIKSLLAESDAIKLEEKRLKERREAKERKAERMRAYLASSLTTFGDSKFETPRVALSFRTSRQVIVDDVAKLDERFVKVTEERSADKNAIKAAITNGEVVVGAYLEEKKNLQIK